mmetsp:Transcript_32749/g.42020  ORF Transcript_32749/g.42020 Transcript_32749/m.42020 type:complete len:452 (-) Transcript_32749:665-2020(-)
MGRKKTRNNRSKSAQNSDESDSERSEGSSYISMQSWDLDQSEANQVPPLAGASSSGGGRNSNFQRKNAATSDVEFGEILDGLSEKRASTREEKLEELIDYMVKTQTPENIYPLRDEAVGALINCLSKSSSEVVSACSALSAFCVLIGPDEEAIFQRIRQKLERIVTRSMDEEARTAALHALTIGCFICSSVDHDTMELLDLLVDLLQGTSQGEIIDEEMIPAALEGWGLLATTASEVHMKEVAAPSLVPICMEHLDSPSVAVRLAAGEVLALIYEATHPKEPEPDPDDWRNQRFEEEEEEPEEEDPMMVELWEKVVGVLGRLKAESSKRMSKRDRKEQRSVFRDIHASIVDGETPEETISFPGGSVTVTSWAKFVQVNALRRACHGGFQNQLQTNPVVQQILAEDYAEGFSNVDRKMYYDKSSSLRKERTQDRRQQRQSRQAAKTQFLDEF